MKKAKIKVLLWTNTLIFGCCGLLCWFGVLLGAFWQCEAEDSVRSIWCCGLSLVITASFALFGCVLRDSRFFSLVAMLLLPVSFALTLCTQFRFIHFYLCEDYSVLSSSEGKLMQYAFETLVNRGMVMFVVLIVMQLALAILCAMSPRFLNGSLRIHRIVLRKIVLFQPSFSNVDPAFYRF